MSEFIPDSQFKPDEAAPTSAPKAQADFVPDHAFQPDGDQSSNEAQANAMEAQDKALQERRSGQGPIAALEAVGRGATGPMSTAFETADPEKLHNVTQFMGPPGALIDIAKKFVGKVNPEDIREREEAFPITSAVGTIGGLATPGGEGALLEKAGAKVAQTVLPKVVGEGILQGVSRGAVKVAAENALYQAGDETTKMILQDPNQSVGTAISNIGLAAALGGVVGGGLGAVSPLWKATVGGKASQLAEDFKGRVQEHLNTPDMPGALTDELSTYYKNIKGSADEVYGPTGLKAQEIQKVLPEMGPKISEQMENLNTQAEKALQEMSSKQVPERYMNKFTSELNTFQSAVTNPKATPETLFNAAQDFKQTLQGYSKGNFGPFAVPSYHEAYDFLNITKGLGRTVRESLEEPKVWGKAAERQQAINKAFSSYLPSLKDFEKKFTSELGGERVIDSGKINTYINQLGKPSAELKQSMLKNFIDASEKYKQVLQDTHANLGIESPIQPSSMNMIGNSLRQQTHGAKLADIFVKRFGDLAGKTLGGAVGGLAGKLTHIPGASLVGTVLGEHALGPFLGSILPSITKPMIERIGSGEGLKSATEYGMNVVKGEKLTDGAVKGLFKSGSKLIPDSKKPNKESREKLDTALQKLQQDPSKLANMSNSIGHYLPEHATAIGSIASNAVTFLNSIRPQSAPKAPLDPHIPISTAVQSQYDRALDVAQQPLIVLDSLKNGTMTSHDIIALHIMYPDLYKGLQQKVMNAMIAEVSKGEHIPYGLRMGLSLFLGQPLDSSMSPNAIMSAQPTPQQAPQPEQQASNGKSISQKAGNALQKGAKSMQTATQASEAMHASGAKA